MHCYRMQRRVLFTTYKRGQHSDTVCRLHSGKPIEWQSASIERTVRREHSEPVRCSLLITDENYNMRRTFESHRCDRGRGSVAHPAAFEPAAAAAIVPTTTAVAVTWN